MKSLLRWLLIIAAVVLVSAARLWLGQEMKARLPSAVKEAAAESRVQIQAGQKAKPLPKGPLFSREETYAFLDAAKRAEGITDPLQRCLAYSDPPHSHWARDAVVAYCKYRNQPIITFAEVKRLVQSGQAAELDHRFAQALREQEAQPDAKGRLDRIFYEDFENGSFDIRPTLDAWKRQSPDSAFAYAASGYAYVQMAFAARGDKYISKTPQSNIESMNRLAIEADADLRHAIELNPKVTPAYTAMIDLGGLALGRDYAMSAAKRGLAVAPDDFAILDVLMWFEQPNWYGSVGAMELLAAKAQIRAGSNPLLKLLLPEPDLYRADHCECHGNIELAAYSGSLGNLARSGFLLDAGDTARDDADPQMMAVYLSEALRFNRELDGARIERIYDLIEFDEAAWALEEGKQMVAAHPQDEAALKARGAAYEANNDYIDAARDWRTAADLEPDDLWPLVKLGYLYFGEEHQPDEAGKVAERLVHAHPESPAGWALLAQVQEQQHRPQLEATTDYIETHFGNSPAMKVLIAHMRTVLAQQARAHGSGRTLAAHN